MTKKGLAILAGITAAFSMGAIVMHLVGRPAGPGLSGGEKMFPALAARLNDVGSVTIASHEDKFTVASTGSGWTVVERGNYPAQFAAVKTTIVALSNLVTVEAKTRNPKLFSRLDVEDIGKKDGDSKRLTIKDKAGKVLADLMVGKSRITIGNTGPAMLYVRRAGTQQAWLARGTLEVRGEVHQWLVRRITHINRARIQQYTIVRPDGTKAVLRKDKPDAKEFTFVGLPKDRKIKSQRLLSSVAGALTGLDLEDVQPAAKVDFAKHAAGSAEFRTFGGLIVRASMAKVGKKLWFSFTATVDPDAEFAAKPGTGKKAGKKDEADDDARVRGTEEARKEAAAINARTKGWAYFLADNRRTDFTVTRKDLTVKVEDKKKKKKKKKSS